MGNCCCCLHSEEGGGSYKVGALIDKARRFHRAVKTQAVSLHNGKGQIVFISDFLYTQSAVRILIKIPVAQIGVQRDRLGLFLQCKRNPLRRIDHA